MEAWVLILAFRAGWANPVRQIDMQSENACVIAGKELTIKAAVVGICVNTFDGTVLYFHGGKMVDNL